MRMSEPTRACDSERLEQYVAGRLGEPHRDALEQHLLECEACAGEVQLLAGVRDELRPVSASRAWLVAIAAGMVLVAGAGVMWTRTPAPAVPEPAASAPPVAPVTPGQDAELDRLARFTPPPYVSLRTRAADPAGSGAFDAAMEIYNGGRYDEAAQALAAVVAREPGHDAAQLFLGISSILAGRPGDAVAPLTRVGATGGPYAGLARLMLARAYLRTRDVDRARRELETLAASKEAQAPEARDLLTALPAR